MINSFLRNIKYHLKGSTPSFSVTSIDSSFLLNRDHLNLIAQDRSIFNGYDLKKFLPKFKNCDYHTVNNSNKKSHRLCPRSWFDYTNKVSTNSDSFLYVNTKESIEVINNAWFNFGPFDVIVGISQGFSILLHWLDPFINGKFLEKSNLLNPKLINSQFKLINFFGRLPSWSISYRNKRTSLPFPSFHFYSKDDPIIPSSAIDEMIKFFSPSSNTTKLLRDKGGHNIPGCFNCPKLSFSEAQTFINFLNESQ